MPKNPHFDDDRVLWDDAYSGEYEPVAYDEQFDDQWRLFLEKKTGFHQHTGVETADAWIDGRICELTGHSHFLLRKKWGWLAPCILQARRWAGLKNERLAVGGTLQLKPQFPIGFFQEKHCLDVGCGIGRWSRTLQELGGVVTSMDVSPHALLATRKLIQDVRLLSIFDLAPHAQMRERFDFVLCWGVIMCTHDPRLAFDNVASTVKPGGTVYCMVYAPTYHISENVLRWRKEYYQTCRTFEEKLAYACTLSEDPNNAINLLDMLNTFYNWVIDEQTLVSWFERNGFEQITFLNKNEAGKCAHHVSAVKKK